MRKNTIKIITLTTASLGLLVGSTYVEHLDTVKADSEYVTEVETYTEEQLRVEPYLYPYVSKYREEINSSYYDYIDLYYPGGTWEYYDYTNYEVSRDDMHMKMVYNYNAGSDCVKIDFDFKIGRYEEIPTYTITLYINDKQVPLDTLIY